MGKEPIKEIMGNFEAAESNPNAFNALLAYEKNCQLYESQYPKHLRYKVIIPKGERIKDFAIRYKVTVDEMKKHWGLVDQMLSNGEEC